MTNPTTEEIVAALRICSIGHRPCEDCVFDNFDGDISCTQALCKAAADRLEELSRWIPVTERLPEDENDKFIKYGFVHNGKLSKQRFIGGACYYLHDNNPHWNNEGFKGMRVTHWMDPPKEE